MRRRLLFWLFLLIGLSYFFLPNIIHSVLRTLTTDQEIIANRESYHGIANALNTKSLSKRKEIEEKEALDSLYLWFHVRGLPIDEDHFEIRASEKWKELIEYSCQN